MYFLDLFSLAVTAIVAWPTLTEITAKKITGRLSLWVEFPSRGVGFTSQSKLCLLPLSVVTHGEEEGRLRWGCPGSVLY